MTFIYYIIYWCVGGQVCLLLVVIYYLYLLAMIILSYIIYVIFIKISKYQIYHISCGQVWLLLYYTSLIYFVWLLLLIPDCFVWRLPDIFLQWLLYQQVGRVGMVVLATDHTLEMVTAPIFNSSCHLHVMNSCL